MLKLLLKRSFKICPQKTVSGLTAGISETWFKISTALNCLFVAGKSPAGPKELISGKVQGCLKTMTILMKGVQLNVAKANGGNGRKIY